MEEANMPIDALQAAKLSLKASYQVRNKMPIKTKWKEYNVPANKHMLPQVSDTLQVSHEMNLF